VSLVRAERRRLFKRRFTRYMLIIGVLLLAAIAAGTWFTNQKVGPDQVAAAEQRAQQEYEQQLVLYRQHCEQVKRDSSVDPKIRGACEAPEAGPRPELFQAEWYLPATFDFKREFERMITVFAGILALVAFVVGASFVGAEWHSGGMMNLLLWRPRRLQVLSTKFGVLLGGLLALAVVLGAAWTATCWAIATYHGTTAKMTPGTWESFALAGARGLALVLVAGAVGFAIASLGRHTAMALGTAIGVGVVGFVGVRIALSMLDVRYLERFLWTTYLQAWMEKKVVLRDYRSCEFAMGQCEPKTMDITWQHSGLVLAAVAALTVGLAIWSMRRRDVA
jgi:ABC-type transport system involved in multi-copper enzyme maturation permease subunit